MEQCISEIVIKIQRTVSQLGANSIKHWSAFALSEHYEAEEAHIHLP